jgi:maleylacetate reductase
MILPFTYHAPASRVVFGVGVLHRVADEVGLLGGQRVLIIASPSQRAVAESLVEQLGSRSVGIYDRIVQHVPIAEAAAAQRFAQEHAVDLLIALGGGSPIGLAKAIALQHPLPIIAIPTTYAGSEMTPIWGLTEAGMKRTGRDLRVLPRVVIYDPSLTLDLPPAITGPSGMNALAHCIEALYAHDGNPITALMAEEGMRALARSLPIVCQEPANLEARTMALYGAWLAGAALGQVSMGLHHKLCHTLGGRYRLPHAELHSVLLPYTVAYNAEAATEAMSRAARAFGHGDVPHAILQLAHTLGTPLSLAALGMQADQLDEAATLASATPYPNPAPITQSGIRALLEQAWRGSNEAAEHVSM